MSFSCALPDASLAASTEAIVQQVGGSSGDPDIEAGLRGFSYSACTPPAAESGRRLSAAAAAPLPPAALGVAIVQCEAVRYRGMCMCIRTRAQSGEARDLA